MKKLIVLGLGVYTLVAASPVSAAALCEDLFARSTPLIVSTKSSIEDQDDLYEVLERVTLTQLSENATVVIKNFDSQLEVKLLIDCHYEAMFKAEMLRMCDDATLWPEINSFESFVRYFSADIHTKLIHLH